jgi:hypothetical protein
VPRGATDRCADIYSFVYWGEILYSCANRVQSIQIVQGIIPQRGSFHTAKEPLWITKGEKNTENLSSWHVGLFTECSGQRGNCFYMPICVTTAGQIYFKRGALDSLHYKEYINITFKYNCLVFKAQEGNL